MQIITCEACGAARPASDTFRVQGRPLCRACTTERMNHPEHPVSQDEVLPRRDLSVCSRCRTDCGTEDLPLVDGQPLCPVCARPPESLRFPVWIKAAFAGCLVLSAVSLAHSYRFIRGYVEFRRSIRSFRSDDFARASAQAAEAARQVPEDTGFEATAAFYRGALLLDQDRSAEAVPYLERTKALAPDFPGIELWLLDAGLSAAFDARDYATQLAKAEAILKLAKDDWNSFASVASALACQFATTGDPALRERALDFMAQARRAKNQNPQRLAAFENRLQFRLATREILSPKDFDLRFPKGWTP